MFTKKLIIILIIVGILLELLWGNTWLLLLKGNFPILYDILFYFRIPRISNALISGIGLAVSGLILQTIFHNPLAGPYVLGISNGAALGVALSVLLLGLSKPFVSYFSSFFFAIIGALCVIFILSLLVKHYSPVAIIITGVLLAGIFSAIINILQFLAPAIAVKNFVIWTMASLDMSNYTIISLNLILIMLIIIILYKKSNVLDTFYLGEEYAQTMGINTKKQRFFLILMVGIIITLLTASYGPLAFVGVIAPHLARWFSKKHNHKTLLTNSILSGILIILWSDFLSHASNVNIPINSILSLMGLPVLLILILQRKYDLY